MHRINMVDLAGQYAKIKDEIDQGINEVIESTGFINGQPVKSFAKELAQYLDVNHVMPCGNGTDALQIALMALGLKEGDEVITVPFTFVATVEVIALLKLKPVFVDIDPFTFNLDVDQLKAAITPRTKCIIPVHLYGQCCHMEPIIELAEKHGIAIIEDAAQAIGSDYKFSDDSLKKAGTMGHIGCTSFYPTKNLGAFGDGGAIFCDDENLAAAIRKITNHGSDRKYYYDSIGVNSRLDSVQAAILRVKLRNLDLYNQARMNAASQYDELLADCEEVETPYRAPFSSHVFHQYTLKVESGRNDLQQILRQKDIPSMIYYPVPLHVSKAYRIYGYSEGDFPVSEELAGKVISLPMHTELTDNQILFIANTVIDYYKN